MRRAIFLVIAVFSFHGAFAAEAPTYGPAPSWVKPLAIPESSAGGTGAIEVLLEDQQFNFDPDGDASYEDRALKIDQQLGLSTLGNISFVWDPQTETLHIHRLRVLRAGKVIDLLATADGLTVIRREKNLEMASLDGTLTATMTPSGLQVGDILEFAYTKIRHDPVLAGHSQGAVMVLDPNSPIDHFHLRAVWSAARPMRWTISNALGTPTVTTTAGASELILDRSAFVTPKAPVGAPPRYEHPGLILFSDFRDWSEVSALMSPLYEAATTLAPDSPLHAEIAKIAANSADPKVRAAAALHLVQQKVRYLFVGLNSGGYTPASADLTWSRRYGDCKGKTALLLALLKGLGITAEPAMASIANGDGLNDALPQLQILDHVLVRATIAGKVYWLDGTKLADRGLDDIPPPLVQWALPIGPRDASLVAINYPPPTTPLTETHIQFDLSAGPDKPATTHLEYIFRGDLGAVTHLGYSALDEAALTRTLTELWTQTYPWITVGRVEMKWDESSGVTRLIMDGKAAIPWSPYDGGREFHLPESTVGGDVSLARLPGPDQDAPFATPYPFFNRVVTEVTLPSNGQGYSLSGGENLDETIAGVAYLRRATKAGRVVKLEITAKALSRQFPADEAQAAQSRLHEIGQKDVWIDGPSAVIDGGPPYDSASGTPAAASGAPSSASEAPVDAAGFRQRGVQKLAAREYGLAVDDLTEAAKRDPADPKTFYDLGVAHAGLGDYSTAKADFDKALDLNPRDALALRSRGRVRLASGDTAGALRDFDLSLTLQPQSEEGVVQAARALETAGAWVAAVTYWTRALDGAADDDQKMQALNGRCLTRAEGQIDLDLAKADCEAALGLAKNDAGAIYGLGLVELRKGEFSAAISQFSAAILLASDAALPMFARGLAEIRKQDQTAGEADMSAATKLDPQIASKFAAWGLTPH